MKARLFESAFSLLAGLLVAFILLPLVAVMLGSTPASLYNTLLDPQVLGALGRTFLAGAIATLLAVLGGLPLAYLLARRCFPGKRLVEALVDLPIVIPHTAAGIALLAVFGRRGLLGDAFGRTGIFFTDTLAGVVAAMLFVSLPFLVNMSREAFALVDPELERVALMDGASSWQAFVYVTLPLAARGVVAGALMMWSRGISEFGAVVILAYYPKIIPTLIFERFQGFGLAAAREVAVIEILAVLVVFSVLRWLLMPAR